METKEVASFKNALEKENAQGKIGYWQTVGTAVLDNDELSEKWCAFVEKQVNNVVTSGALLDETLQVMTMIKSNMPSEIIAQTIKQIPHGQTVLDSYLRGFIHPEILYEVQSHMYSKKL